MKKLLFVLVALLVGGARADNIITSREYVDAQANTLQTTLPAKNTNTVLLNTATAGEPGAKAIYDSTAAYGAQTDALVTAGQFNTAVQNALESEFVCIERQNGNGGCLLYEVRSTRPHPDQLHNDYTRLEYIESTGTQYILTGTPIYKTTNAELTMRAQFVPSESCRWMGANAYMQLCITQRYSLATTGTARQSIAVGNIDDIVMQYKDYLLKLYVNGQYVAAAGWEPYTAPQTFLDIFAFGSTTATSAISVPKAIGKIYNFTLKIDNQLVHNLIPARRDSDNALGMYDTVSNTFFTNAGTGEFIAGPVVSSNLYLPSGN